MESLRVHMRLQNLAQLVCKSHKYYFCLYTLHFFYVSCVVFLFTGKMLLCLYSAHLKNLIYQKTNIPPKNQWLTGCRELQQVDDENILLKSLGVPKELKLRLEDSRRWLSHHGLVISVYFLYCCLYILSCLFDSSVIENGILLLEMMKIHLIPYQGLIS